MKLAFRTPQSADDLTFVLSSWLDASRSSYSSGLIQMSDWYQVMWKQYEKAMHRDGMRTVIAYEKTDPTFLYGWIVADPTEQRVPGKEHGQYRYWPALVVFVFVKQNYRREGIARQLFEAVGVNPTVPFLYACNTVTASRLVSKVPLAKFDPLTVRFPKEKT